MQTVPLFNQASQHIGLLDGRCSDGILFAFQMHLAWKV